MCTYGWLLFKIFFLHNTLCWILMQCKYLVNTRDRKIYVTRVFIMWLIDILSGEIGYLGAK